jgi:stage II sporulation protein AB (anti-sigma F factor)
MDNQAKLEFKSLPANVSFARVTAAAFASQLDFTLNDIEEIKVAVSEAVANAIIHGYDNQPGNIVTIIMTITENTLEFKVEDYGKGIANVKKALEPSFSTDPERMGLGFVFMQSFMDNLHVESFPGKGTTVTLRKSVGSPLKEQQAY